MMNKKLLVVDGRSGFCEYVRRVAADLDYEVETAATMGAFRASFEAFAPTALFIDLVTLGSGVIELSLWLAEESYIGSLIVTGAMDETRAYTILGRIENLGPVTVMRKPVRLKDLRDALSRRNSKTAKSK